MSFYIQLFVYPVSFLEIFNKDVDFNDQLQSEFYGSICSLEARRFETNQLFSLEHLQSHFPLATKFTEDTTYDLNIKLICILF